MSASFIGSYVQVRLQADGDVTGSITGIDPNTGTLTLYDGHQAVQLARSDIADLSIITPPPAGPTQQAASTSQVSTHPPRNVQPPTAPAAMSRGASGTSTPKSKGKATGGKKKQQGRAIHAHTGHGVGGGELTTGDGDSDLDTDFDFDKALKGFDKQKIWQEIKTADRTDPSHLLVSHNRRGATPSNAYDTPNGGRAARHDEKLAWNEPVLSPTASGHADTVAPPSTGVDDMKGMQGELDRIRGSSLQRDLELSKIREQVKLAGERANILEALLGVRMQTGNAPQTWKVKVYESTSALAKADADERQGLLTVSVTVPVNGKLRYLGPIEADSDAGVLQRLPETYKGEMGLKVEHAPLFFRRLKDAIQL